MNLKKFRALFAIIIFIFSAFAFVDIFELLPPSFIKSIFYLQFVPSLIRFLSEPAIAVSGFIFVLLFTVFFGRIYCSFLCPFGILMDIIGRIKSWFIKKPKYRFSRSKNKLRYSILALSSITLFSGSTLLLLLLDPYSNFGRIMSSIVRPGLIYSNNLTSRFFEFFDFYLLKPFEFRGIPLFAIIFALSILALIIFFTWKRGRIFCNTLCPVGALLSLPTKFSIKKIHINHDLCKGCGVCEKVCKAECINSEKKEIDFSSCVVCFNCLEVCPTSGIVYSNMPKSMNENGERREFITHSAYWAGAAILQQVKLKPSAVVINRKNPVAPPGASDIDSFTDKCTACHLCVSVCPTNVLLPSFLHYGFTSMLMPRMDYWRGFCNFDCTKCTEVCPTGALTPLRLETKKLTQLGQVKFIKENCIVHSQGTDCGACAEHCPTKAVRMEWEEGKKVPVLNDKICIGCGACEFACPTKPYKAIYVEGNHVHKPAEKPKTEKLEDIDTSEDFPF